MFKFWDKMSNREQLEVTYYEMHRDAWSYRPSTEDMAKLSDEEMLAEMDLMSNRISEVVAEEAAFESSRRFDFEVQIGNLRMDHNINRATAIRWYLDAEGFEVGEWSTVAYEAEHFCYCQGMGCTGPVVAALVAEIINAYKGA